MKCVAAACLGLGAACSVLADEGKSALSKLDTYEFNSIGWTKDSDDPGFLDVRVSLKYPLFSAPGATADLQRHVYFAASFRFGQYLGTRHSSPVVGKRFNPKLLWRQGKSNYIDFAYAHESNGQSIDSEQSFRANQELARFLREPDFIRDYISRGWDYLELAARRSTPALGGMQLDLSLRHFLRKGLLQGPAEDYRDWERDPQGKPRRQVHGLAALGTWRRTVSLAGDRDIRFSAGFETGGSRPLRYNTVRAELAWPMLGLPFLAFWQQGYGSDLALYYKRVSSWGLAAELAEF